MGMDEDIVCTSWKHEGHYAGRISDPNIIEILFVNKDWVRMSNKLNLIGEQYGMLTVVDEVEPRITDGGYKIRRFRCVCKCGNVVVTNMCDLRSGDTRSCGCYKTYVDTTIKIKHGGTGSKLHNIWKSMKKRCGNAHNKDYKYYGGKGVVVCDEWACDYVAFEKWANENGYKDGLTIDRISNDDGYNPSNCRWISFKKQCNNRTSNRIYTHNGETHTISEWSEITGIKYSTLYMRLLKMNIDEAINYKR